MPWRKQPSPYFVLVSELMLQQTQVDRVLPKFKAFVERFPDFAALAAAPLGDVLSAWSGLGYNRRAQYLWRAAQAITAMGAMPNTVEGLVKLPGVGPNTAGAIMAYVFEQPVAFVETNIRTVFIHHFFADSSQQVTDSAIKQLVANALPVTGVRQWYWALMDYGTHLKATAGAQLHRVKGYKPQSRFAGSLRQVRGEVLRQLIGQKLTAPQLAALIDDSRLTQVLAALVAEGLVVKTGRRYRI